MTTKEQTIPKGYKHTEVGIIPSDWEEKYLGSLCGKITTGKLNANAMVEGGEYRFYTCAEEYYQIDKYAFDTEALLVSGNGANVGYVHYYKGKFNAYQRTYVLSDFNADVQYLKLFLDRNLKERIRVEVNAGNTPYITMGTLTEMKLAIPKSKTEQTAIATALSDTDALIEKLTKLIEKKKNIKQGAMQELLTGKRRLPGFGGKWETKKIGQLGKPYGGLTGKIKSDFGTGNSFYIPFMNIMSSPVIDTSYLDVVNIRIGEAQHTVQKGDLFFNGSSETPEEVGMCSVLMADIPNLYLNSFCFGFRLNQDLDTSGLFFAYYFRSNVGRDLIYSLAQGATRYNLSKTNFLKLDVPYPEPKEQTAIATVLSDMDTEIERLESQLAKYQNLKQGMMQTLLTGKIRLI